MEELLDLDRVVHGGQHPGLVLRLELADQVRCVVVGQLRDELGDALGLQPGQERAGLLHVLHLGQRVRGRPGREEGQQPHPVPLLQVLEEVRQVAGVQRDPVFAEALVIPGGEQMGCCRQHLLRVPRIGHGRRFPASRMSRSTSRPRMRGWSGSGATTPAEMMNFMASSTVMSTILSRSAGTRSR